MNNIQLFIDILTCIRRILLMKGYAIDGTVCHWPFYLPFDGIYPNWTIFVKPNPALFNEREKLISEKQMGVRKDVERLFGVFARGFRVIRHESHEWSDSIIILISQVCVILHNMIVDMNGRGELGEETDENGYAIDVVSGFGLAGQLESSAIEDGGSDVTVGEGPIVGLADFLERDDLFPNLSMHCELTEQLPHHIWNESGEHKTKRIY